MSEKKRWFPLESNPEIMNKYVEKLGLNLDSFAFTDVYGLDDELLAMVPQPVLAVLMLYPITKENENESQKDQEEQEKSSQRVDPNVYFIKQTIGNACGTIALLHSIANNQDLLQINDGFWKDFIASTKDKSPEEKATLLEDDKRVETAHEESANEGSTNKEANTDYHFVAFVAKNGILYELDGRKKFPLIRGQSSPDTLLHDVAKVIKNKYLRLNPNEVNFTMVALSAI
jgi:ubiquitin carboxyl-terminal hydrolase L3